MTKQYVLIEYRFDSHEEHSDFSIVDVSDSFEELEDKKERYNQKSDEYESLKDKAFDWFEEHKNNIEINIPEKYRKFLIILESYPPQLRWDYMNYSTYIWYSVREVEVPTFG